MGADKGMAGLECLVKSSPAAASSLNWHVHPCRTDRQGWPPECICPPCCLTTPRHNSQEADSRLLSPVGGADDVQVFLAA